MDANTTLIIIVIIFAIVLLAWALLFRKKGKASIEAGPVKLSVEGENPTSAADVPNTATSDKTGGVDIENTEAGGGILVEVRDGGGARLKDVKAGDDILVSSEQGAAPKA